MTKPTIVTRAGKGSALTWTEGDTNLTNLRDATITVSDGSNSKAIDLNGTIQFTAGSNATVSVNSSTGVVTVGATATSPSGSNTQLQYNNSGSFGASSSLTFDGTNLSTPYLKLTNSAGDEGGEMLLAKPATNSTIAGTGVTIDVYQNKIRFFEQGGSARGAYIDITAAGNGVGTNLLSGGGGMTSFTAAGDSGTSQTITDSNTLTIAGGTGLSSVASATDTITINLDDTTVSAGSYTYASITVDAQGRITSASNGTTPLVSGGALGTPSSGTVTNLTGTASININGTVGATTANTGAFTTLSASSTVSGTGFSTYLASPPAIGGTAAAAGSFTNLSSTGTLTFKQPIEAIYDIGTTGGTIAPNCTNGSVQKITLNSALTINAFTSPVAGQSLTLIIYGGTAYTSITSTMKFAGGVKTLTGTAGCIDILSVYYDGTNYFASLGKGYA